MRARRLTFAISATAACAAVAALAGCGASASVSFGGSSNKIDASKLQDVITHGFPNVQSATCPSDQDSKVGVQFDCTATLKDGSKVTYHATVTNASTGHVQITPGAGAPDALDPTQVEDVIKSRFPNIQSASCPPAQPLVTGTTFDCMATLTSGSTVSYRVTLTNAANRDVHISPGPGAPPAKP
jgi:hypothetical protein